MSNATRYSTPEPDYSSDSDDLGKENAKMRKCECCLDDAVHQCKTRPPKDKEPVRGRKKKVRPCVQEMFPKEHPSGNWRDHLTEPAADLPLDYSELCSGARKDKDKKCRAQGRRGRSKRRRRAMSLERGTIRSRAKELGDVSPVRGRRGSLPQRESRPIRRERYGMLRRTNELYGA